jgi:DNA invertase Pin-like site-specific DNA recombinase
VKPAHGAAIYARISSDPSGQAWGVQRQLEDCREQASKRGITVAQEYVDNDVSAFSGKRRPAYQQMLADIRDGLRDAVIVYNLDRLTRRPIELEEFSEACAIAGVRQVITVTAELDMSNDDGLFTARIMAAVAAKESARKSERVKRKMRQNAEMGLPHAGGNRPYGYEADRLTIREAEADVIREMADRFLAGESPRSLAADFQAREVPTSTGKPWRSTTVRNLLLRPRIAGLREHNGDIAGPAVWPAVIPAEQFERVRTMFAQRAQTRRRAPRRYLLSGLLRCGRCGGKLFSSARENRRRYVCLAGPDHGGCGRLTIEAERVEEWLTAAVLYRLDTPEMAAVLTGQQAKDERYGELAVERDRLMGRMTELGMMFAAGEVSRLEWKAARDPLEAALTATDQQLARLSGATTLVQVVGHGKALQDGWENLNLERQHAIIRAVLDYATIKPAQSQGHFHPDRVVPTWAL